MNAIRDKLRSNMPPKIIAEVAQGYEGKPDYCDFYVRTAAKAGADAVKFQIVYADDSAEPGYQYYDWYKQLEMDVTVWKRSREIAREQGILFFTDISGEQALLVAKHIRPDGIKIHASNFFNRDLIRQASQIADQLFVSIGGIKIEEVDAFLVECKSWGVADRLVLLYGYQAEPTPIEKSNLARISLLKQRYPEVPVGYMDHTAGEGTDHLGVSVMAMTLGAEWIEKHLTISRYMEVEDHVSAVEPQEFARYVKALRELAAALGPCTTELNEEERTYRDKAVKKLVMTRDLGVGEQLSVGDLQHKRTARIDRFKRKTHLQTGSENLSAGRDTPQLSLWAVGA